MSRVTTSILIRAPRERVFDYVTTPAHWIEWHPSTLAVSGATDHPLQVGEQITEDFAIAGRRSRVYWTVREREVPSRWRIEGRVEGGGSGSIIYTLVAQPDGTLYTRDFAYSMGSPLAALVDWLFLRRRIAADSAVALAAIRRRLEGPSGE